MSIRLVETLETKRLKIRQSTVEDNEFLVNKLNDAHSEDKSQLISYFTGRDSYSFSILLREIPQIIGYIILRSFEKNQEIECYYGLFSQYIGNGYAIEALRKVFEFIFTKYEILKIVAYVQQGNTRGWKVAERSGMKYMGDIFLKGRNSRVMSFLINRNDYTNQLQF
jgi:RimJ/RimL family protein N-acetyltransferase